MELGCILLSYLPCYSEFTPPLAPATILGDCEDNSSSGVKKLERSHMEDLLSKELAGFLNAVVEFSLTRVSSLQLQHLYKGPSPEAEAEGVFGTGQGCCMRNISIMVRLFSVHQLW